MYKRQPIWLLKTGKISRALACDIRPGPLETARKDGAKYEAGEGLSFRLSDGLRQVSPEEAKDVVIAGMGGELILRIVEETPWLRDPGKRLVLQPMSSVPELRLGLAEAGFQVLEEEAVIDGGKVYSAFSAAWTDSPVEADPLYPTMGKLRPGGSCVEAYARKVLRELDAQHRGAVHTGDEAVSYTHLQAPAAPACFTWATFSGPMPPMAYTGRGEARHTCVKNSTPRGGKPGLHPVGKICPRVT